MGLDQPSSQSSPRYELETYPSYLRPIKAFPVTPEGRQSLRRDDANQAWGDYMAQMEGTEI